MSSGSAHRDLLCQLNSAQPQPSRIKMAAETTRGLNWEAEESIADQDAAQDITNLTPLLQEHTTVSTWHHSTHSPASTESLIRKMMEGLNLTPLSNVLPSPGTPSMGAPGYPLTPSDFPSMMEAFSSMLSKGLAQTVTQITNSIHADLQQIGARIDIIEKKTDQLVAKVNQNSARIQDHHDHLETALFKIDDLENRSRSYTFRIQGLPESIKEVHAAVHTLIKDLIMAIPEHCLEIDRAHRALQPLRMDGLPRDIIVKPHFYPTKEEEVMKRFHNADKLTIQGHQIQISADLSPYTVQKRRSLKPLLQVLTQNEIAYRWSFPFRLNFSQQNKPFGFSSFTEGERLLLPLGLITQENPLPSTFRGSSSAKRPSCQKP